MNQAEELEAAFKIDGGEEENVVDYSGGSDGAKDRKEEVGKDEGVCGGKVWTPEEHFGQGCVARGTATEDADATIEKKIQELRLAGARDDGSSVGCRYEIPNRAAPSHVLQPCHVMFSHPTTLPHPTTLSHPHSLRKRPE